MGDTPRALRPSDPELERLKVTHQIDIEDEAPFYYRLAHDKEK